MASGVSDGALIVDTKLDNSGFLSNAKQFMSALNNLKQTANKTGQAMGNAGNAYLKSASAQEKAVRNMGNEYRQLQARVVELNREINRMQREGVNDGNRQAFNALNAELEQTVARMNEVRRAGGEVKSVSSGFRSIVTSAGQAARTLAGMVGGGAFKFLQKLAAGAKNAAVQLAKLAARAAASSIKRLGSLFAGAAKSAWGFFRNLKKGNSGGGGLQVSLKNLLRYGLGIRSLFALFNRLRGAIKEGFAALAEQNPEVRASLSALSTALNGLKGALASAFAPILTAVTPALVTLINLVTQAANAVGMLMAALTGKGFYSAAKGAASVGKAAGGAAGGVKKLNRELAGFDELNILKDNQSGGGGGGGGGGAGAQMFENVPVDSGIAEFVEHIKELFGEEKFEEIGGIIAGGISKAFQKALALLRGVYGERIGANIGKFLNGLFGDKLDWDTIGTTIGDALGVQLEVVGSTLGTFDLGKAAQGASTAFQAFSTTLSARMRKIPWTTIGQNFANGINSLFTLKNFIAAKNLLSTALKGVFSTISTAAKGVPWSRIGSDVGTTLSDFINNDIPWDTVTETFTTTAKGIFEFGSGFLDEFEADKAAENLKAALKDVPWGEIADAAWEFLSKAASKFGDFVSVLFGVDIGVPDAQTPVEAVEQMWDRHDGTEFKSDDTTWQRLGKSLGEAMKSALLWLDDAIVDFDWEQLGEDIKNGINAIDWPGVKTALFTAIGDLFDGLSDFLLGLLGEAVVENTFIGDALELTMPGIKKAAKEARNDPTYQAIRKATREVDRNAKKQGNSAGPFIATTIGDADAIDDVIQELQDRLAHGWKPENLLTDRELTALSPEKLSEIKTRMNELGVALTDGTVEGLNDEVKAKESEIENAFVQAYGYAKRINEVNSPSELYYRLGMEDVKGFVNAFKTLPKALAGVWEKLPEWARALLGEAHGEFGVNLTGDGDGQRMQKQTNKELKQNTKALKKLKGKKTLLGLDTSGLNELADGTQVKVGVNFVPGSDKATDSDKDGDKDKNANSGLLGWLQQIFDPGVGVDVAVSLIRNGWSSIGEFIGTFLTVLLGLGKSGWDSLGGFIGTFLTVLLGLGKSGWDSLGGFIGTALTVLLGLGKDGWTTLGGFIGTALTVLLGLGKSGWTTLGGFIGTALTVLLSLGKNGWTSLGGFIGTALTILLSLGKNGWTTITQFFGLNAGNIFNIFVSLFKGNTWNPEANAAMTTGDKNVTTKRNLKNGEIDDTANKAMTTGDKNVTTKRNLKNGEVDDTANKAMTVGDLMRKTVRNLVDGTVGFWASAALSVGDSTTTTTRNLKDGTVGFWAGAALSVGDTTTTTTRNLKDGAVGFWAGAALSIGDTWTTTTRNLKDGVTDWFAKLAVSAEDKTTTTTENLAKGSKWNPDAEAGINAKSKTVTTTVNLVAGKISEFASKISEGIKTALGNFRQWLGVSTGGAISAGGHLTRFAAGGAVSKAGALRWWDHIPKYAGGTSRAHGTMFVAGEAGPEIVGHINGKTEILNKSQLASTMYAAVQGGMLAALKSIQFRMPVMATGSVTPYAVASDAAQRDRELQDTMNNNNEDLIQAMVSAIGNAANAIITAVQTQGGNNHIAGLTSRQVLDEFNRAAMMYAASPLKGV